MTTIAFKDNILAADTMVTCNGLRTGYGQKIERVGRLRIGGAGSVAAFEEFRDWVRRGMKGAHPLRKDIGNLFVVMPDARTVCWSDDGPFFIKGECWALGSGDGIAEGAMLSGRTAADAVRVAIKADTRSGGDVTVLGPPAEAYSAPILQFKPRRSDAEAWSERLKQRCLEGNGWSIV